jgi:Sigma-70 region 2
MGCRWWRLRMSFSRCRPVRRERAVLREGGRVAAEADDAYLCAGRGRVAVTFAPLAARRGLLAYRVAPRLGSHHDAEDVAREALAAAWRHLPAFGAESSFPAWLGRIVTCRTLNKITRTRGQFPGRAQRCERAMVLHHFEGPSRRRGGPDHRQYCPGRPQSPVPGMRTLARSLAGAPGRTRKFLAPAGCAGIALRRTCLAGVSPN